MPCWAVTSDTSTVLWPPVVRREAFLWLSFTCRQLTGPVVSARVTQLGPFPSLFGSYYFYFFFFFFGSSMWHMGPCSLSRDRTQAPCIGSMESYPPDHQGSPSLPLLLVPAFIVFSQNARLPWSPERPARHQSLFSLVFSLVIPGFCILCIVNIWLKK